MTFPFAMLSHLYEVDAPGTLGPSAFSVVGAGSSAVTTVTVDEAGHVVHVDISGMTFSKRHLKGRRRHAAGRSAQSEGRFASAAP
jgi:hypothetical protein